VACAVAALALAACGQAEDLSPATQAPTAVVTASATALPSPSPTQAFFRSTPSATPAPTSTPRAVATSTATRTATATAIPPSATPIPRIATATPEPPTTTPTPDPCPGAITWDQAINHVGAYTTVIGPVVGATWASESRGKPTFLNLGLPYPEPGRFTILIWIDGRWNFPSPPEEVYAGRTICATGTIELYEGSAEMLVEGPWQIVVVQ
jgi:hypothetical protein